MNNLVRGAKSSPPPPPLPFQNWPACTRSTVTLEEESLLDLINFFRIQQYQIQPKGIIGAENFDVWGNSRPDPDPTPHALCAATQARYLTGTVQSDTLAFGNVLPDSGVRTECIQCMSSNKVSCQLSTQMAPMG